MGVEPTIVIAGITIAGFEDRGDHRTTCASDSQLATIPVHCKALVLPPDRRSEGNYESVNSVDRGKGVNAS